MDGPLSEDLSKQLIFDLFSALSYCHQHGVVHRDVKMENILIDYDNESGSIFVELIDFGLAALVTDEEAMKQTVGTSVIMAPELFSDARKTSFSDKIDCWSLGVVMFELVIGVLPFYSSDNESI